MDMNVAPMVYSRVLRAIAAANTHCSNVAPQSGHDENNAILLDELARQLNDEFAILGVRVQSKDLAAHQSALDIARFISQKIG
jgi:hypothetical protein